MGGGIDEARWVPWYLPHWSSRAAGTPRLGRAGERLVLQIDDDQQPWCPEFDGNVVCSVIQTGLFAGPLGSDIGQLRFNKACRVREEQENRQTCVFQYGYVELRCRAVRNPLNMCALWLMGYEDRPERSGEICLCELKGWMMTDDSATIGFGIHPWRDPSLVDDFREVSLRFDATVFHTYALDWTPEGVTYLLDGQEIGRSEQSPAYPQQVMLGIYEFPGEHNRHDPADAYPKQFEIDYLRIHQRPR